MRKHHKPKNSVQSFDFISTYTRYADVLEAPREMHEMVATQLIATSLNINGVKILNGSTKCFFDLWLVLLSGSGFGRSTLITMADPIIEKAEIEDFYRTETWGSSQGLQQQISMHPTGLYVWGELSEILRLLNDRQFINAKTWITDRYDNYKIPASITYRETGKKTDTPPIEFKQPPRINILATSSLEWFFSNLAQEDSTGGFLPRWLLVVADDTEKIVPRPKLTDQRLLKSLADHLKKVTLIKGDADFSNINRAYGSWYHETIRRFRNQPNKALAKAYFNRHRVHILKLAVIYEVSSSLSLKVSIASWRRAVRTARKLEKAIFQYLPTGMNSSGYLLKQMEDRIRSAGPEGLRKSIFTRTFQHQKPWERDNGLTTLIDTETVQKFFLTTRGRPAEVLVHKDHLAEFQKRHKEGK